MKVCDFSHTRMYTLGPFPGRVKRYVRNRVENFAPTIYGGRATLLSTSGLPMYIKDAMIQTIPTAQCGPFTLTLIPDPHINGTYLTPSTDVMMAEVLMYNLHIATDKGNDLYVYENGVYRKIHKDIIYAVTDMCKVWRIKWSTRLANSVIDYITARSPVLDETPNPATINLVNGIYFIYEDRFEPHEDQYKHWENLSTVQLPIVYDPLATCDRVDMFLHEVFPGGKNLLYDLIGSCLTSDTSQHKAIVLIGSGCNGKSVFLYGLRAMVGAANYSSMELQTLADPHNRFANNNLVGKLINGSDDTAQGKLLETSNIKSIISGNPIMVEGKFKTPFSYKPYCKLIFGTNHRLASEDDTDGYYRRFMHIPFTQKFTVNPVKEKELIEMFNDSIERSGVFNQVIKRLERTLKNGFQIPDEVRELVETFDPIPSEASKWLQANVERDENSKIIVNELWASYWWHVTEDATAEPLIRFIMGLFPGTRIMRSRTPKGQKRCFMGLKWSNKEMEEFAATIKEGDSNDEEHLIQ